jgi:hypothetical protein
MKSALWTWGLPAGVVLVLVIAAVAKRGSGPEPVAEAAAVAPAVEDGAAEPVKPPQAAKPADAAKPAEGDEKPATAVSKSADDRRVLLQTVGTLTAVHAFQTYLNIGFVADGKAKGTYTDRDARKVLDTVLKLQDAVDDKLAAVSKTELDKDDRASLEDMRSVSDLLHKQAKELEAYWDSGKEEDEARYEDVRKDSWAALNRLMGSR